jgi:tetratricopeptide (TPR) repeat protein
MRGRLRQILIAFLAIGGGPALADALDDLKSGLTEAKLGRREAAIPLLTSAIESEALSRENRALALAARAYAYQRGGEYVDAVADYDAALELAPDPVTFRNRGAAYMEWGHYEDAVEDFAKALSLQHTNAYLAIWLHIARLKAGTEDKRKILDNLERVDPKVWPGSLLAHFAGRETLAEVTRQAQQPGDAVARAERRCDMAFFLGEKHLTDGDADALRLLREARDVCPADSIERAIARGDMLRMGR